MTLLRPLAPLARDPRSTRLLHLAAALLAALALAGCGSSRDDSDDSDDVDDTGSTGSTGSTGGPPPGEDDLCSFTTSLSGAYTASQELHGCGNFWLDGSRLSVYFGGYNESAWQIELEIEPVTPGQTGAAIPALLGIEVTEGDVSRSWGTGPASCTVDLTRFEAGEDDFFGPGHHIAGEGRCSTPAKPTGSDEAMGEVTIAPFQFRFFATPHPSEGARRR